MVNLGILPLGPLQTSGPWGQLLEAFQLISKSSNQLIQVAASQGSTAPPNLPEVFQKYPLFTKMAKR